MTTTQTNLFPPAIRGAGLGPQVEKFLLTLQMLLPLVVVDTTSGNQVIALPPAGLNSSTGQSNQNQEIIYLKTSADANTVTLTGAVGGNVVLASQYALARFKSDGTEWFNVTANAGGGGGGALQTATYTLTSAQLLALHTSGPIVVVPGQAGKILVPVSIVFNYVNGGVAYNTAGTVSLNLGWDGLPFNNQNITNILTAGFLDQAANQVHVSAFNDGPADQPSSALVGKGLNFGLNTSASGNLTLGNGTLQVSVSYVVVSAS